MIPLYECYPYLHDKIPYVSLGEFPTPVQRLRHLGKDLAITQLYIKRDDLSGKIYGGNKVRKLEFLLGKAIQLKTAEVMTFGAAGSNHALATSIYAKQVGLKCISILIPQPNAHYVRRNLIVSYHSGAEMHPCGTSIESRRMMPLVVMETLYQLLRHKIGSRHFPLIIPPGGSTPLGCIGFVNAAFELKEQIMNRELPEPDYIYVATGTMGTASGLIVGLRAAGLKTRVISVRVLGGRFFKISGVNISAMRRLIRKVNYLLSSLDKSFPTFEFADRDIDIRHGFLGQRYALFTNEGMKALNHMQDCEGIKLDGTYTGKALAALVDDTESGYLQDKVVLFWNTVNSRDFSKEISAVDYHNLPSGFHRYFEEEVQPLDSVSLSEIDLSLDATQDF